MLLLYLGNGGHGDRLTGLFGGHRGFYDSQWQKTPATLVKRDSNTSVFQWTLQNF